MAFLGAIFSCLVTGFVVSLALWLSGMHHVGIVLACGVLAGAIQLGALIAWYLAWSSPSLNAAESNIPIEAVQPN
jgi:zinc transporter ZupT